jgi:hypothetical protein
MTELEVRSGQARLMMGQTAAQESGHESEVPCCENRQTHDVVNIVVVGQEAFRGPDGEPPESG